METVIRPFAPTDARAVQQLVLGIQRDEFGIPITLDEQPDLVDVPAYYRQGKGGRLDTRFYRYRLAE